VVQLYVSDKSHTVERPVKELKGFDKVTLAPGETTRVRFALGDGAFSYFDAARHEWVRPTGAFEILIGSSSRDIRRKAGINL
jgi:beta-glucosidase